MTHSQTNHSSPYQNLIDKSYILPLSIYSQISARQISKKIESKLKQKSLDDLKPIELGLMQFGHGDERRIIDDCNLNGCGIQHFYIKSSEPLGNHYHKNKREVFVIVEGKGIFTYLPLNQEGKPIGKQKTIPVKTGNVIKVAPFTAHAFRLNIGSTMWCFSSAPFDSDNLDMHFCKLHLEEVPS
ncbi:MAG TPA: hypothetical protein V6D15_00970 [Oculatellaceae cyanobacterium]|jgi:mannose-6-phosphate isomerase-like protein (cupin superfamily)